METEKLEEFILYRHEIDFLTKHLSEDDLASFADIVSYDVASIILKYLRDNYNKHYFFDPEYDYALKVRDGFEDFRIIKNKNDE